MSTFCKQHCPIKIKKERLKLLDEDVLFTKFPMRTANCIIIKTEITGRNHNAYTPSTPLVIPTAVGILSKRKLSQS
jgi:hypothetical protein